ncbi:hypothetical protein ACFLXA_03370 [Chloroflexota bacterium]
MADKNKKLLLIGDNPFHGISHLSQDKARSRDSDITRAKHAAHLINVAMENGANGFLFSVSDTTLAILRILRQNRQDNELELYAIMPYAFEYVRLAVLHGGITGLARKVGRQVVFSGNVRAIINGLRGAIRNDPGSLLKAYLSYEVSRIRSAAGKKANLNSILIHEVVTDMGLALDMQWLFEAHIEFARSMKMKPGFDTRNLPYLVKKFGEWQIDLNGLVIAAPFNAAGFQMCPSRQECEKALDEIPEEVVIAFSLLAAGYLKPQEAAEYITKLANLKGVVLGVSREEQVSSTFRLFNDKLTSKVLQH